MSNVVFACTAPSMAFFQILSVYCALGFGLGRFCVSKRALHARGVRVLHIFAPLRAQGSGFFRFCALTRGGFQVFSSFCAPVWPLQGDFRAFPAGVIPFPALPVKAGFSALCGAMPPFQKKQAANTPLYRVGTRHLKYSPVRVGVEHPPPPRHAFRVPLGTGGGNFFQLYESF